MMCGIMLLPGRRSFLGLALALIPGIRVSTADVTLDEFIELSERLLNRKKLDRRNAQLFLDALNTNADDATTLAYLVQSNGNPTPEMRVLAATIIEWWRTGTYFVRGERRQTTPLDGLV